MSYQRYCRDLVAQSSPPSPLAVDHSPLTPWDYEYIAQLSCSRPFAHARSVYGDISVIVLRAAKSLPAEGYFVFVLDIIQDGGNVTTGCFVFSEENLSVGDFVGGKGSVLRDVTIVGGNDLPVRFCENRLCRDFAFRLSFVRVSCLQAPCLFYVYMAYECYESLEPFLSGFGFRRDLQTRLDASLMDGIDVCSCGTIDCENDLCGES